MAHLISLVMGGGMAKKDVLLGGGLAKRDKLGQGGRRGSKSQDLSGTSFLDVPFLFIKTLRNPPLNNYYAKFSLINGP